jgi:hypothetical protein
VNPNYFRQLAQRCLELMPQTRSEGVRRQLVMWVEEFEARAAEAEREQQAAPTLLAGGGQE